MAFLLLPVTSLAHEPAARARETLRLLGDSLPALAPPVLERVVDALELDARTAWLEDPRLGWVNAGRNSPRNPACELWTPGDFAAFQAFLEAAR